MAHCMKMTRGAIGHMMKHYERAKDENGEYIKFGNDNIDTTRSAENYNLAIHQTMLQGSFIKKRCSEVKCLNRKDVNVACSWIVTAPKDLDPKEEDNFFLETYLFLEERYGKENVISAYVHKDEITPHMHFAFVPVFYNAAKDEYKVSAKDCITRAELKRFHTDLQKHLDTHEIACNVLNGATRDGNKSIEELKRGTAIQELQNARQEVQKANEDVQVLLDQKDELKGQIEHIEGTIDQISKIDDMGKLGLFGKVTMTYQEAKSLREQAKAYALTVSQLKDVIRERDKLQNVLNRTESSLNYRIENVMLKKEIEQIESVIKSDSRLEELYDQRRSDLDRSSQREYQYSNKRYDYESER